MMNMKLLAVVTPPSIYQKTSHKCFCLAKLENLMEDWPGGSYLVLNSNTIVPGDIPLMAIVYKYNSR